ncbi:MAG: GntR family transcriptional regulator [Xanthobacteraceae bacterium]|nr:GntR family transcriptional regulator [Xanthobacteraceae bacterium]MBX3534475.1 GntR family transcriptional regulator [Xanthobacteraceae bacterium]MBX3547902.1 GntR family transcriptional regulator [Xanthobacteraceae bacterium]MCW5674673.1 GntR family transcriptional regulator [Xanthobacteraceae bacterium]MCW5677022.1 GntR family transcriptional regulator [Xanthobacteraceae bacterium]
MHKSFGNSPVPRYAQLADLFRGRIARGIWVEGRALPTIEQLTREFDVARVTVRQAINLLAQEGLVSPERGRGTYVNSVPQRSPALRLGMTLRDLADVYRHDKPQLTLIEQASAMPRLVPADGKPAPSYHFMKRVHSRNGERYCVISIYVDQRIFKKASSRFRKETIIPVLLEIPGLKIARASQTLGIGKADMDVAQQLGVPVNTPVAEVRRVCTTADGTVIYLGEVTYRGDYIQVEMDLKP